MADFLSESSLLTSNNSFYSLGWVAPRHAAELCLQFLEREEGLECHTLSEEDERFPERVLQVEDGFPRLALGIAFHLHNSLGYPEDVSKSLAQSMVHVWIKHEVPYRRLQRVCRPGREGSKDILSKLLEAKVNGDQDQKKAKSLQFSSLIDMTVKYFEIASLSDKNSKTHY